MLHSHKNLKFLRTTFLLASIFLMTTAGHSAFAFSGFSAFQVVQQQDTSKRKLSPVKPLDTTKKSATGLKQLGDTTVKRDASGRKMNSIGSGDSKIEYAAVDSIKWSDGNKVINLYGKARVIYQSFELDADYIRYDTKKDIVFASGRKDAKGKYLGKPIFKMDKQGSSVADSLFYNTKSGKGTVFNTFTEQEGGFFSGGQSKRQPDNEIHVKGMTYSTCNLPHPHFGIFITKGIVTDKQIITGPVYLKIEDIPLPLGLPFAFFPKPNKRSSGVIIPQVGDDYTRGFFFREGGYYLNLSDYLDAKILGTIYTRGSYGVSVNSNYIKRYKYSGNVLIDYESNRFGLEGTPEYTPRKDYSINWNHSQNANANPGTSFSASVRIKTSAYNTNTAGGGTYNPLAITENVLYSSITYGRNFSNGINYTISADQNQNTNSKMVSVTLPTATLSVPTFNPFDSKTRVTDQKWYQKITVGYSLATANRISTGDSILFKPEGLKKLQNGAIHTIPVSLSLIAAKFFNVTTSGNYTERWQFQSVRQRAIRGVVSNGIVQPYSTITDTVQGFNRSGEYNFNISVNTKVYNTLEFKKLGNLKALRLVTTPTIGFSYSPDFSALSRGNYKELLYQDGTPVYDPTYNRTKRYSIHQGTLYGGPGEGQNANINFSLDNVLEAKVFSSKDTTGSGTRKVPIIQGLNFSGFYNMLKPTKKLSNISFNGRSRFTDKFEVSYQGTLNPYAIADSLSLDRTMRIPYESNRYAFPRLTNFGLSFGYSLNADAFKQQTATKDDIAKKGLKNGMTAEQAAQLAEVSNDPNAFVDFKIPWNFTFNYNLQYSRQDNGQNPQVISTLNFNGDFNVTPKWKVTFTSGWDFKAANLSPTTFHIYRDLHCWDMNIGWTPIGAYKSYNLTIRVKASILQDLKLSKQQGYYTRF